MSDVSNLFSYAGKRALVVGCYSGMGAATSKVIAALGAEVHGVDYKEPDFELASFRSCDLRNPIEIDSLLESFDGQYDSVFYCAGLPPTHPAIDVMRVNFAAMRKVVEGVQSKVKKGGAIAIISSTGGLGFMNHMESINELLATDGFDAAVSWCEANADTVADGYVYSKEVVIVYTMKQAMDAAADGVRVNCISPGPTQTPMMPDFESTASAELLHKFTGPANRYATPEEMAWPLAFLNSDAASYITGLNLIIDGGFLAGTMTGAIDINSLFA